MWLSGQIVNDKSVLPPSTSYVHKPRLALTLSDGADNHQTTEGMSCMIINNGDRGFRGSVLPHPDTKTSSFSPSPVRVWAELYVESNDNCTAKKLQPLLVVVIVEQTPASATDRPAGPWEDFHATPGGTVNYPARRSNICFCASAEQTRQFQTYQGITKQQLNMTLIPLPRFSHTRC